jgi:hypothetical protein
MAWHYARKPDWLRCGVCLLVILMSAASTEHFSHQKTNSHRAICPHCSDDDSEQPDNN